ncbi:MAG: DMT family transporter [Prevotellaceae bacterium]|jgi:drug/metabolite transporter (DMT)-like permease|nr:DMT family transporter [Prevotellaceae bacterium]
MKSSVRAHLAIGFSSVIFGLNAPISKDVLSEGLSAEALIFLRVAFAAIAFGALSLFTKREKVPLKDVGLLALCGLFGVVFNQGFFLFGLAYTSSVDALIVTTITPVLVMCLAAIFLKEPITGIKILGVIMGAVGALIIILHTFINDALACESISCAFDLMKRHGDEPKGTVFGALLCFCSSLSYAIYLAISKPLAAHYSSSTIMCWMFLFAALGITPIGIWHVTGIQWSSLAPHVIPSVGYILFFATFITYLCIGFSMRYLRPTTLSMYNYMQPLVASIAAILAMQDKFEWYKVFAAILIFGGVYVVTKSRARAKPY